MGSCLSATTSETQITAKVITWSGQLREYPLPATVYLVLDREAASSPSFFMCNSDGLNYDDFIPVLDLDHQLLSNQIYFILPKSKLHRHLSAPDMAAMAVMATSAIASTTSNDHKPRFTRYRSRISPLLLEKPDSFNPEATGEKVAVAVEANAMMAKSGSVRRMQKSASRRAKMAVRSFRLRLTTIYEGATLGKDDSRFN